MQRPAGAARAYRRAQRPLRKAGNGDVGGEQVLGRRILARSPYLWTWLLYGHTVNAMKAPSKPELHQVMSAKAGSPIRDVVVHWQSAYGLIVVEVRGGQTFVNGDLVEPLNAPAGGPRHQKSTLETS